MFPWFCSGFGRLSYLGDVHRHRFCCFRIYDSVLLVYELWRCLPHSRDVQDSDKAWFREFPGSRLHLILVGLAVGVSFTFHHKWSRRVFFLGIHDFFL